MTRLQSSDIAAIPHNLKAYDQSLKEKTGLSLKGLAMQAAGGDYRDLNPADIKVAAVSFSSGQGIISGFSHAVSAIALHLGFDSFVSTAVDGAGIAEAIDRGARLLLFADDHQYVAVNPLASRVVYNDQATAAGFVTALGLISGDLAGREVLLIGAGKVGRETAKRLIALDASVAVYDLNSEKVGQLIRDFDQEPAYRGRVYPVANFFEHVSKSLFIIDASPASGLIDAQHLNVQAVAVAPGIPLGFTPEAVAKLGQKLVHDPLQIGSAVMIYSALTV